MQTIEPHPLEQIITALVRDAKGNRLDVEIRLDPSWEDWFRLVTIDMPINGRFIVTIDPASVAANTTAEQTFTVKPLSVNDLVMVNKPTHDTGLGIVGVRVSAKDTLAITFANVTGSAIDPPSEIYKILAVRF